MCVNALNIESTTISTEHSLNSQWSDLFVILLLATLRAHASKNESIKITPTTTTISTTRNRNSWNEEKKAKLDLNIQLNEAEYSVHH